jgi:hypothetical protein
MKSKILKTVTEDIKQEFKNKLEKKELQIREIEEQIKEYEIKYETQKNKFKKEKFNNITKKIQEFENSMNQDKLNYININQ